MIYLPRFCACGTRRIVRNREAQFCTTTISRAVAGVVRDDQLRIFRKDLDAIQSVRFFDFFNDLFALASKFIHLDDGIKPPVRDKKRLFINNK